MKKNKKTQTVVTPEITTKETPQSPIWKWIFWALASVALIAIIALSLSAGNSGDEHFHLEQAEHVYNYYATGGQDSTAAVVTPKYNLPYYGQCVDNLAYFIVKKCNIQDTFTTRHVVNSIFGWLAMLFIALAVQRIYGWRGAVIAMLLAFFSPRLLGHSFNNLKDLPLATGMAFGLYCIIRFLQESPNIKWPTAILLALSIGFTTAVRFAGILIIAFLGLYALIYWIKENRKKGLFGKESMGYLGKMALWGAAISIVGIVITILFWPFLLRAPVANFKDTVANMSSFAISLRQLFEGSFQWSDFLPWYYTPKFILMTIPVAVIIGMVLFFIFCWRKKEDRFWSFIVFFSFLFPVFWIVYTHANVYGGWRHAMFAYPPMVVAAALGFEGTIKWIEGK